VNDVPPSSAATADDRPGHQEHGSPVVRALFLVAGSVAFTLGIAGVLLPLLPATPLFILAAACFARAYRPFHEWMLGHRWLGPMLKEWYQHGSLPYRTKIVAIVTMLVSFGLSVLLVITQPWLQALLAITALALAVWLYRIPSRDGPAAPP
jgi:uncharacterized membrane protein YbaN (DUF454 family)